MSELEDRLSAWEFHEWVEVYKLEHEAMEEAKQNAKKKSDRNRQVAEAQSQLKKQKPQMGTRYHPPVAPAPDDGGE